MTRVYVSLGSNINREANTRAGVQALRQHYGLLQLSSVYESDAVGFAGDCFYNMVIGFDTNLDATTLARQLRDIELAHGRDREGKKFSSRTLDLDLLLYGDAIIDQPGLKIPREDILKYAFVLWPLAEIAPQDKHPQAGKTYAELWQTFDKSQSRLHPIRLNQAL